MLVFLAGLALLPSKSQVMLRAKAFAAIIEHNSACRPCCSIFIAFNLSTHCNLLCA